MGVMLAMSAIFAVVITTISIPGDKATAQDTVTPDAKATQAIAAQAKAWFNSLTLDQAINALLGKGADAVTDVAGNEATIGRQYVDGDDPANNDQDIEFIYAAWMAKSDTQTFFDGLPENATGNASEDANQARVNALVDGDTADPGDLYAVGEQVVTAGQAIRGFQSVELWWNHLTCAEARIAVGEDDGAIDTTDQDADADGFQAEESKICDVTLNDASTDIETTSPKAYKDVKAMADKAGQAILGLDAPGSSSSADNARAEAWWGKLTGLQRARALYGDGIADTAGDAPTAADDGGTTVTATRAQIASQDYDEITTSLTFTVPVGGEDTTLPLNDDSKMLVNGVKALINDRWQWIYNMGGANEMGTAEVVYWWNNLNSGQRRVATGTDNEPQETPSATGDNYGVDWDALNPAPVSNAGQGYQARVLDVGQAILGVAKPAPQVAAWWNTLNKDQMVYVVYGNPPMRTAYDHDDDTTTPEVTTVTDADKAVFQKMYDGLTGGIVVEAANTALNTHLPEYVTAMLERNGFSITTPSTDDKGTPDDASDDTFYYSAKGIVNAIANEIFDAPTPVMALQFPKDSGRSVNPTGEGEDGFDRNTPAAGTLVEVDDDNDFDWPYNAENKAANVRDWWESLDCRAMRIAVGEDNQYLNAALAEVEDDTTTAEEDESMDAEPRETSRYCGHFPGSIGGDGMARANSGAGIITDEKVIARINQVGQALLGLDAPGRPSFNEPATGNPMIMGTAQVGATLTVNTSEIADEDGLGELHYQWLRNGEEIPGATGSSYTLTAADAGATISIRVTFTDSELYLETRTSPSSLATSLVTGSPGEISRIEPGIRRVTLSAGDSVKLSVDLYGLQNVKDNSLSGTITWSVDGTDLDVMGREIDYKAPSSPGTYMVKAQASDASCQPADEDDRASACSAEFEIKVRRPSAPQPPAPEPVNPSGDIPSIIADSGGNQYEVFTPVEGGSFSGEGYSLHVGPGSVQNGEVIGIRMSQGDSASNAGMTHQRYTLGGYMYGVHAVDASGSAISSYVLDNPATVCLPLPDELRQDISDLAVVAINGDGSLTILSAQVRISAAGTMVCGHLSGLPASVAVGSAGAPAAIPTATPEPTPEAPDTGGTAPSSSTTALWTLLLGIAVLTLGSVLVFTRRRASSSRSK